MRKYELDSYVLFKKLSFTLGRYLQLVGLITNYELNLKKYLIKTPSNVYFLDESDIVRSATEQEIEEYAKSLVEHEKALESKPLTQDEAQYLDHLSKRLNLMSSLGMFGTAPC